MPLEHHDYIDSDESEYGESAPSSSHSSTAIDSHEMRHRRGMLAKYPELRQQAIADFILSTASAANDLRRFVELRQQGVTQSHEMTEASRHIEDLIRRRYRECFGAELGQ